ncbi:conserved hypothetical protein [Leishmania major strain Friedlin]|uniref:AAA+ ATPase domain-containing protein n=1 Tax=Leishmania major TaxID=5664 RepID=Q4QCT7_LEIMA|nr:conserved hypothetical protein [Leishmania major strain Friedlin]CAG9573180.1 hypothetical_protein_-_conserved [Leishmania major strain Friedlin]CAJ04111.1 conserved hypothetical protein [Leishmania major strain Friedlin]|eukprot:XP_001682861.1 conserved hypothetical protein [Leishmania major strain Friedlin]
MRHYSEHLTDATAAEENGACGEMNGSAGTLCLDHVANPTALRASVYGTGQRSTAPRHRNAFLEDISNGPKYNVNTARNRARACSCSSRSSAATYDSDVEGSGSPSPRDDTGTCTGKVCLLNPQQTSLFRAPRGETAARYPPEQVVMADGSWLTTIATTSSTTLQKPSLVPSGSTQEVDQQRENSAQARFREALRHAYQCEDAHRQRRRAQLDKQQEQLLRGVELLQGVSFSSSTALLAELLPSRGRDGRRSAGSVKSPISLQPPQPQLGASPLALLATSVEAAVETGAETIAQQSRAGGASTSLAAEACLSSSCKATTTPQMGDISKRLLQVMSPAQAQRLRRPLNPFIEALLRHYQEAQLKQRAARHAEDQAIHARRMYELPVLTEDVVRYAALLLCLRRRRTGGSGTAVTRAACAGGSGMLPSEPARKEPSSSTSNAEPQPPQTLAAAEPTAALPFGEEGTLLYLKYPPPLLRTTSFAVETVRLLKWLRTWKKNGPSVAGETGGVAGGGSSASVGGVSEGGSSSSRSESRIGRKRVRADVVKLNSRHGNVDNGEDGDDSNDDGGVVVVASPTPVPHGGASSTTNPEVPPPNRSTVERVSQQAQHAVEIQEAQLKQERRSAFLKFFGAAAVTAPTPPPTNDAEWNSKAAQDHDDGNDTAKEVVAQKPVSCSAMSESAGSNTGMRDTAAISVGAMYGITSSVTPISPPSNQTQLKPSTLALASHAYQLYCHAWKNVVKTGITPLAVAANAFCGPKAVTGQSRLSNGHDNNGGAAATSDKDTSWTDGAVPRVCAGLPFFKEMREEARRTALGSANNGTYYEDAFGNRLRSARLAKKEQEQRELLVARQRRRAKKKGYFHRHDDNDGRLGGRAASNGASAMLEAMLRSSATCGSEGHGAGRGKKRRRGSGDASSDDASEGEGVVQDTQPHDSSRCAAARRARQLRSRASSSYSSSLKPSSRCSSSSSSSTASMASGENDEDEAGAKDELTNIAVVSGPTGSGKTAAVYMAAQLLGFHVVEMNASVRRCSKTVEHLLAELTRSYRLSGPRPGTTGGFNAEEELAKLKQQHAVMLERARAEAEAAERTAELKKREALKVNGISVQAVANFFAKGSGRAAVVSSKTAKGIKRKDAAKQVSDVDMVSEAPAPAAAATSSSPQPAATAPGTPVDAGTLLLFEDADVLLGDESAKPFYAAIRDLAHRSKVPIVVAVSSDPAAAQRYDTEPFLALLDGQRQQRHTCSPSPTSALQPTYWQLCDAAGLNSIMATMEAAHRALQVEADVGNRGASTTTATTITAAAHENNRSPSAVGDNGGRTGAAPVCGAPAASFLPLFSSAGGGGASGSAAPAACAWANGASAGVSTTSASGGGGGPGSTSTATSAAAAAVAARYTHMLLNATLVSSFFGSQTPFTVVDPLPPSALYAQLLAVGAVELDLLRLDELATSPGGSDSAASLSSSSSQQELERMATRLTVCDTGLFRRLAEHLRHHIFGAWDIADDGAGALVAPPLLPGHNLVNAVQCDAARSTTTDVRYWLNKLQVLLLSLRAGSSTVQMPEAAEAATSSESVTRKRSRETMKTAPSETTSAACGGENAMCDAKVMGARRAEHLVEAEFQHRVSLAASEWDAALGRHLSNVAHNEQHSTRYEHWFLDAHVCYIADIVEELATTDHPTARVDHTTPLQAPARCGRPPSSSSSGKKLAHANNSERKAAAAPEPTRHPREEASACMTRCTSGSSVDSGSINSAWQSFFAASGASEVSTLSTASPVLRGASPADPRQQTLLGCGGPKAGGVVVGAPPPPSLIIPTRYEWPPSALELRRQACSHAHLRPVELLLPYGAAEAYYGTAAASTSTLASFSIHDMAEPTAALLGHETPLRFPMRHSVRDSSTGDNGKAEEDAGRELPAGVRTTQEERFRVFRKWWCRPRQAGALRDSVAGRSAETLEDIVGFGCLLTPPAAETRNATSGSP